MSLTERELLYGWKKEGVSLREIGRRLGRKHSSLVKELRRNRVGQGRRKHEYCNQPYIPALAQEKSTKRALKQRQKAPLKEPLVFLYVREHIREPFFWTPEQISGRLPIDHSGASITAETIYRYIYSKKGKRYKLFKYLTLGRKQRMKQNGRSVHRDSSIPGSISIDLRPEVVSNRSRVGDWESDLMEGKRSDDSVVTATVERLTRVTLLDKLMDKTAQIKTQSVSARLLEYPKTARLTVTVDNGKENSYHQQFSHVTGADVYFCHAYHSWEKPTVENTIGRIRRFTPKGVSIHQISDERVKQIEIILNNTPRKCLGYLTPNEKLLEYTQSDIT